MIKTQLLVKRKLGMTMEAFADYWLNVYRPLAYKVTGIRRQTISIVRAERLRSEGPWDALVNIWWDPTEELSLEGKLDSFRAMIASQCDVVGSQTGMPIIVLEINPLLTKLPPRPNPDLYKIVNPLYRRKDLSYEQFSAYWSGPHAVLNNALPNMNAYIQNHIHPDFRDTPRACDGIAESWFHSWQEIRELTQSEAHTYLKADEVNLLAPNTLHTMICQEFEIV